VDVVVRKLTDADVDQARQVQAEAFAGHDRTWGEPVAEVTPVVAERQRRRVRHFLANDPDGSWVAELEGAVVGLALALRRDRLWGLSMFAVDPAHQSLGIGRQLIDAALGYARPDDVAVILSTRDPRAMRRYAAARFDLHPQIRAVGRVDRSRLPSLGRRVREGGPDDFAVADAVDVVVRGAPRGPDHPLLAELYPPMFVVDDAAGRGYAYPYFDGGVHALAATDEATATDLLWRCIAHDVERGVDSGVDHVNAAQQWAVRVIVAAGLTMQPAGPVFWRGRMPPAAYLPSGPYL